MSIREQQEQYLKAHFCTMQVKEIQKHPLFAGKSWNAVYKQAKALGLKRTKDQTQALKSEAQKFRKGNAPANALPIGSERIRNDRGQHWQVKTPAGWRRKHYLLWEKSNGPIPKGSRLYCKSKDMLNTDPSNWLCLSASECMQRNLNREKQRETMLKLWDKVKRFEANGLRVSFTKLKTLRPAKTHTPVINHKPVKADF